MKLTMWRAVVVLNTSTKFKGKIVFIIFPSRKDDEGDFPLNLRVRIKDNNSSPHDKFHRFYFHFLANFQT